MAKKGKQQDISYLHMSTNINIRRAPRCQTCPYKIFANDDEVVTLGTGNIHSNIIFVLPTYDIKARVDYDGLLTLLSNGYKELTSRSLFDDVYTTRLVKCNKNTTHSLYTSSIGPCSHYLIYELNRLVGKKVVFFGTAYDDYNNNADTVGMNIPIKKVYTTYSPGVLYYDNAILKEKLFADLNAILYDNI